jgi:hypothetical protein
VRPYLEKPHPKNRAGGAAQGVGSEFKPPSTLKKKKKKYEKENDELQE